MEPNHSLHKDDTPFLTHPEVYQRLIGKLFYLYHTRPDISFAVTKLCQFSTAPREVYLQAAHKVLRYLKGSIGIGLFYSSQPDIALTSFKYADWAVCPVTRCSGSGYCMFIGDTLISWKSKKQATVSCSSAEAKYKAMSFGTKELIWIVMVIKDLMLPDPAPVSLFCDSIATLHIAKNHVFHERTKYLDLDYHKVCECVTSGFIKTLHVRSEHQLADALLSPYILHNFLP